VPAATDIARPTYNLLMSYVMTPTTNCSTRLFAYLITCYIPSFRRHPTHHKDTICETERIYCNYLIIRACASGGYAPLESRGKAHGQGPTGEAPLKLKAI